MRKWKKVLLFLRDKFNWSVDEVEMGPRAVDKASKNQNLWVRCRNSGRPSCCIIDNIRWLAALLHYICWLMRQLFVRWFVHSFDRIIAYFFKKSENIADSISPLTRAFLILFLLYSITNEVRLHLPLKLVFLF